ncbi:hypothetical protein C6P42_002147 [Pichia californica]|nr:hypothetical protein C6P42_002147 [[Candida] californica]
MDVDIETVLSTLRDQIEEKDSDLAAYFYSLEDYHERKLWYQLSEVLKKQIYSNPNSRSVRLKLYDNFISTFKDKINQLQLVEFLVISLLDSKPEDALEYLSNLKQDLLKLIEKKNNNYGDHDVNDYEILQALIYLDNELAKVKLKLGFIDEATSMIDVSKEKIDNMNISVDNRVNSSFYYIKAELMKVKGDFNMFYYNSLLFLACIPNLGELDNKENIVRDICISGLLGDKIYNFGEIIMHDIFKYLSNEWLKELLLSLNDGNLNNFNKLIENNEEVNKISDISSRIDFLKQKMCIMAFVELVFSKPTTSTCIQYNEIINQIPFLANGNEIEHLVMKCLSLGLIKGLINQVEENVEVSWIQPRTMTLSQIQSMKVKMEVWNEKVGALNEYMGQAGVSISSSIYDRRALDCTDDKALVNSLNHLTFLTSSSVKVRDAMIQDGAVERLVGILYECKDPKNETEKVMFAWKWVLSLQCLVLAGTRGTEKMRKKLVDAGIIPILATILDNHFLRKKSAVKGDNNNINTIHSTSSTSNNDSNSTNSDSNNNINNNVNDINNISTDTTNTNTAASTTTTNINNYNNNNNNNNNNSNINNTRNNNPTTNNNSNMNQPDLVYLDNESGNNLVMEGVDVMEGQLGSYYQEHDHDMLDENNVKLSMINEVGNQEVGPLLRFFSDEEMELLNVVEQVKCLQKLGDPNSNYDVPKLMNTHFSTIKSLSNIPKEFCKRLEVSNILSEYPNETGFKNITKISDPIFRSHTVPRSFRDGLILPENDDVIWSLQLLAFISKYTYLRHSLSNTYLINGLSFRSKNNPPPLEKDSDETDDVALSEDSIFDSTMRIQVPEEYRCRSKQFINSTIIAQGERLARLKETSDNNDKGIVDDYMKILHTNDNLQKIKYFERIRLNSVRLKYESLGRLRILNKKIYNKNIENYSKKWSYDDSWDEFESGLDVSKLIDREIQPFVTLNIFPLVERFTVKTWFLEDICYWAAVVVRNANRKDEKMGGRRQCANFNCGIWEDHPKQFSKCRRCKRAKYCSRSCQTKAWVFHKHWCIPAIGSGSTSSESQEHGSTTNANTQNHVHTHPREDDSIERETHGEHHATMLATVTSVGVVGTPTPNTPPITGTTASTVPSTGTIGPQTFGSTDSASVSVSGITESNDSNDDDDDDDDSNMSNVNH